MAFVSKQGFTPVLGGALNVTRPQETVIGRVNTNPALAGSTLSSGSSRGTTLTGTSGGLTSNTNNNSSYIQAIQQLVQQNRVTQQQQLEQQQAQQSQLLNLQRQQTETAQKRQQESLLINSESTSNSYIDLLKKLMSVSNRNTALNQRMFS